LLSRISNYKTPYPVTLIALRNNASVTPGR